MNLCTESSEIVETFVKNVLFWGKPAQSVLMMNVALFGCLAVYISLYLLPLRTLAVFGLWISALRNSEFFNMLGISALKRLRKIDYVTIEHSLVERKNKVLELSKDMADLAIAIYEWLLLPLIRSFRSIFDLLSYLANKFVEWRKRKQQLRQEQDG